MPMPNPEPIGLPAPAWLLQFLLVLTFTLHLIPMTVTLGGTLVALVSELAAKLAPGSGHKRLAQAVWRLLPSVTAFTITLGVAPLLFVQLIYAKFFYPASILTAWTWFAVVPLLLLGYGMLYLQSAGSRNGWWRPWSGMAGTLSFLTVAAIYVSTMSLTTAPEQWKALYAASQGGTHWYLQVPRYLHVLFGTTAMAGALVGVIGHTTREAPFGRFARRTGLVWLGLSLVAQVPVSLWFQGTLPAAEQAALNPILTWGAGLLALAALATFAAAAGSTRRPILAWIGAAALTTGAILLAVQRHLVRQAALSPNLTPADWAVEPQWDVFAIFAVLLIGSVALVGYLVLRFNRAVAAAQPPHHAASAD